MAFILKNTKCLKATSKAPTVEQSAETTAQSVVPSVFHRTWCE